MSRYILWMIASAFLFFSCVSPPKPPKPVDTPNIFWLADPQESPLTPAEQVLNQQWIEQYHDKKNRLTKTKKENPPNTLWLADPQESPLTPAEQALNQQWIEQHQAKKARITKIKQDDKLEKQTFKQRRKAIEEAKQALRNLLKGKGLSKETQVRIAGSPKEEKNQ